VNVVATPEAQAFIAANGGVAYVKALRRRCCGGALTVLSATTTAPADAESFEPVGDPSLGVRYRRAAHEWSQLGEPGELLLEVRGRRRPRLNACWDGCAFKI
jgi:hypothetical protein